MSLVEAELSVPGQVDPLSRGIDVPEEESGKNLLELAWRNRWLILLFTLIGVGGAWVTLQRVTPCYTSLSRIYVERNVPRLLDNDLQIGQSTSFLYTQAELIGSTSVLANALQAPGIIQSSAFRETENPVGFLRKYLQIEVGQNDDIINVSIELPVPEDAAAIVNAVVEAYIAEYADRQRTNSVEVLDILRKEKLTRDQELEQRRQALDAFRFQHSELAVQVNNNNVITERFAALSKELTITEIALLEAKARYNRVQKMFDTPSLRPFLIELATSGQQGMGLREVGQENEILMVLRKQSQDLQLQMAAQRARWGDGHPRVKTLVETLTRLEEDYLEQERAIEEEKVAAAAAYVDSLRQEFELLVHKRDELQASHDEQFQRATEVGSHAIQLTSLEEALERTETFSDILDQRIKEVNLTEQVGAMNVSIMEVAVPSPDPSFPSRPKFLAAGILFGAISGFGLGWLRDLLDHRLRSIDEITAVMQLPVLGALHQLGGQHDRSRAGRIVIDQPRSTAAESFRTLRTAIHFGLAGHDERVLLITSPSPGDGKSTAASNIAISIAQADNRVLLIDADMRKPRQHEIFAVDADQGLSTVLSSRSPVEEAIVKEVAPSLDLLPCGPLPSHPVELLNNGFFADMLEALKDRYDKIVIDAPPVMPVADSRVIAAMADATLLVLRAERSTRRTSVAARNELWQVRAQRIGIVVNGVPTRKQRYGYGYGYGYGGGYGGGYGAYGYVAEGYGEETTKGKREDPTEELEVAGSGG